LKKQNFVEGAIILMIANLLVKVFGAIFKIPLTNIIGVEAMAYFNSAYGFYVIFYMISTAGLPVAVSKLVSSAETRENKREVEKIFRISYTLFFIFGLIGMIVMVAFASAYADYVRLEGLEWAIFAISPTLFFICLTSAFRGYFQGLKNMTPTAVSQICEAIGKLVIGLVAAFYASRKGYDAHYVAAFSLIGVTIGALLSTVVLRICKKTSTLPCDNNPEAPASGKLILKRLIVIAIPITLSATIMSLTNTVDTTFMVKRLMETGLLKHEATKIMGTYTSMSVPLFNLPPNLIYPFAISIIPALTSTFVSKNEKEAHSIMTSTFRIASIISVPCAFGLSVFAYPIITLLYSDNEFICKLPSGEELTSYSVAAPLLSVLAISIFFVSLISVTNSILQSYEYERATIISTSIGIVVKVILTNMLISNEHIGMYGAPVSTLVCYFIITVLNFYFVVKYTGFFPSVRKIFIKPIFAAAISIVVGALLYKLLLSDVFGSLSVIFSIGVCGILYFVLLFAIKGVERTDILLLPKGNSVVKFLEKTKMLK